ncbi:MAG: WYL domain-containing protein, partial [Oscillospiraceae bacterium]|nr:WYL domain-containing protein [Oscillospiraceae bacterium]
MSKSERQKLKLLYLRDYLKENTDEAHPASTQALIAHLAAQGIRAERKSIYDDMEALREYGIEVCRKSGAHGGYYVAARDFSLAELKMLVDAVLSSRFLTPRMSMELSRKLAAL